MAAKNAAESLFGAGAAGQSEEGGGKRIAVRFLAGSAAGATATTLTYPLDLLRARYAAQGLGTVTAAGTGAEAARGVGLGGASAMPIFGDMARILRVEGVRGLYGGITPTLIGIIPYAGISFATFETLKGTYVSRQRMAAAEQGEAFDPDKAEPMPVMTRLLFGGLAGLFAQSVTYPLDIVRRRIQVVVGLADTSSTTSCCLWFCIFVASFF